jgi:cytoskeletal protein RodZ
MNSIGQELKQQRELKNIQLEEIAKETKISIRFLKAIEEDKFNILPEGVYRRNFIASYAKYIGADVTAILNRYKELYEKTTTHKFKKIKYPATYKYIDYAVAAAIIVIVIITLLIYSKKDNYNSEKEAGIISHQQNYNATSKSAVDNINKSDLTKLDVKKEDQIPNSSQVSGLELNIIAQEDTWIEIQSDNEIAYKWMLRKGEQKTFKAKEKILFNKIGNAGGIKVYCNGVEFLPLGKKGEVIKNIMITPNNIKDYAINTE